ncbi:hypothetical protein EZV62_007417 [Acer yangbiense]|uniref:DUF7903 domain-containing protein n=1 Tax=Acer yangbiense TaxID=1000413 RepID=A0A5C7IBQ3_9ROSI|nr:hypothetical protein EZV62_007417 [Acer yangbiense]
MEKNPIHRWFTVGLDVDNQFPSSVRLEPTSVESFEQRMLEKPLVLVNSHPATKGYSPETISSTPWESVAIDVWPNLLSSFEIVRKNLEYFNELNEEKPALVARFGKILFQGYVCDLFGCLECYILDKY